MDKAKIFHITYLHDRYDTRIFQKECFSLGEKYDVFLIVNDGNNYCIQNKIKIFDLNCKNKNRFIRLIKFIFKLDKIIVKEKPKIIHIHDPELLLIIFFIKKNKIKIIFDMHEDLVEQILEKEYIKKIIRKPLSFIVDKIIRYIIKNVNGIITAADFLTDKFKRINKNIITIWNYPINQIISKKKDYFIENEVKILFIGTAYPGRGIEYLYEILSDSRYMNKFSLTIIGTISNSLKNIIEKKKNNLKISFINKMNYKKLYNIIKNYDIGFVCDEDNNRNKFAIPVKMLEYMAAGLPVIVSNLPILVSIIKKYKNGFIIDIKKKNSLPKILDLIIEKPELIEYYGQNGIKAILKEYNWNKEKNKLFEFYEKMFD